MLAAMSPNTRRGTSSVLLALPICALLGACGAGASQQQLLPELREAMGTTVETREQSADNSRVAEKVAEADVLQDMARHEVEEAIGRGEPCSRHPKCAEKGFDGDDWYYQVGQMGSSDPGRLPALIVGFDRFGKVDSVYHFRTH